MILALPLQKECTWVLDLENLVSSFLFLKTLTGKANFDTNALRL